MSLYRYVLIEYAKRKPETKEKQMARDNEARDTICGMGIVIDELIEKLDLLAKEMGYEFIRVQQQVRQQKFDLVKKDGDNWDGRE